MKHIYINKRYFFLILGVLSMLFIGCTDNLLENDPGNKTISTLEIKISVPGKTTLSGLRSMSIEKETEIDLVQALLFEEIESGKEVFRERYTIKKESFTSLT